MTSPFAETVIRARDTGDSRLITQAIPYARMLGLTPAPADSGADFLVPAKRSNVGNPTLPALHGGAIGGFMELSAGVHLLMHMDTLKYPKIVDFSIDYVRAGKLLDTWISCEIVRQGRRLVNMGMVAWQADPEQPIAKARAHFLLSD
ncbi:PaaI family thioesterase [Simiduia agarivorans]|uniref:Thioesterase superfamily protein n=1 Tax=Simiduia agarivorans (strain DSM 21679 / JCM 13881 / BCRC 17597 / SA1) TaxID=1117647 RepID=K4KH70_SIMAS|nr:PaaI family thioesterase [Simiduia agarivorans]AFU97550.1 thioesterase superfamily protein [Simiduia agarivorans SA1 = DSM 21679]